MKLLAGETTEKVGGEIPEASRVLKPIARVPRCMRTPSPPLFSQLQRVLQPAGPLQYVGVVGMAVALAGHLDAAESVRIVHVRLTLPLCIDSIPAFVLTLDHLWNVSSAAC